MKKIRLLSILLCLPFWLLAQKEYHGKILDSTGQTPLSGAVVQLVGSNVNVSSDDEGVFHLTAKEGSEVKISLVGYQTLMAHLGEDERPQFTLLPDVGNLEQVIVVGYGTQRKIDVTGAVVQIKGDEIAKQPSVNPVSGLQGKVAGVQITNNGAPGTAPQIKIRGNGTVYGSGTPLYVVDGVWYDDISFINSSDIETMSILKDASAESIYGIRAANGVVLITTKKGKKGQAVVNYTGSQGWQKVTNQVKMANANQYATLLNELTGSTVVDPADYGEGTNWYDQILRVAPIANHQISVSGGTEKSTYNFSLSYLNQDGIVETNNYKRYTARLQNDFQIFNNFKVGYNITGIYSQSRDIPQTIFRQMFAAAPILPVKNSDGSYGDPAKLYVAGGSTIDLGGGPNFNPQATIDFYNQQTKSYRFTGNVYAEWKLWKSLTFKSSIGGDFGEIETRNYTPVYVATTSQQNNVSKLNGIRSETRNWLIENTLTYNKTFGDHSLTALVGQSAQRYKYYQLTASINDVPTINEGSLFYKLGDPTTSVITDDGDLSTVSSYFARVNYAFQNKYMVNASLRADGSSKFYGDNRWGYFPSVGLGWVVSSEKFMAGQHIFDNLKLRASWGKIGNASVPSNISVLTVSQFPLAVWGDGSTGVSNSIATLVPLTTYWERGVGTDIGVEMAFLKRRLSVEADYYNRKTEKAIFDVPILSSLGTTSSSMLGNQATFQNKGFEFLVSWKDNIGADFYYNLSANLSINTNKVLEVYSGNTPIYSGGDGLTGGALATRTMVGRPIGEFYGYNVIGIFQNQSEIDNYKDVNGNLYQPNAKPGDFKYESITGSGPISGNDRVALGNPNPKYSYGFNTQFGYKAFDLAIDFQGVAGVSIYNANLGWRYGNENFSEEFYNNRWHGEGTSNTYPSVNIGGNQNYLPNSFFVESGAYFRIRNIQLGYTLPSLLVNRYKISRLRIFAGAQNPFNFFKYRGFSPEVGAYNNSPLAAGMDVNVYPLSAIYNFGLNLTF